eukprot:9490098-Pyramimonas_sp.AAC.1
MAAGSKPAGEGLYEIIRTYTRNRTPYAHCITRGWGFSSASARWWNMSPLKHEKRIVQYRVDGTSYVAQHRLYNERGATYEVRSPRGNLRGTVWDIVDGAIDAVRYVGQSTLCNICDRTSVAHPTWRNICGVIHSAELEVCLLYTSPSPRDRSLS